MTVTIKTAPAGQRGIHITVETVQELLSEKSRIRAQQERLRQDSFEVDAKLEAIHTLAPHLFPQKASERDLMRMVAVRAEPQKGSATLVEAVVKAVTSAADRLLPAEIRAAVEAQGDGGLLTSQNYLYTAIKRAVEQGKIAKFGDRYGKIPATEVAEMMDL